MNRNIYYYITFILTAWALSGIILHLAAAPLHFVPQIGYSQVTGSSGNDWKPGFTIGLDMFQLITAQSEGLPRLYGLHFAYNRWLINSDNILKTDGHDMRVEREKGIKITGDVTGLVRFTLHYLQSRNFRHWIDIGMGIHYIRSSAVEVKGFYRIGDTAVNREISRDPKLDVSPSITVGFTALIHRQIQPSLRYQHFFESGVSSSGVLLISLGLLAR